MSIVAAWKNLVENKSANPLALAGNAFLGLLGLLYRLVTSCRNWLYDKKILSSASVDVPVVSIGNLTLGGTGKTPCVEWIAKYLREQDLMVAILSRGYGSDSGPNDEALLLEENLPDVPHLQGRNRAAVARTAIEELESQVLILDDGFQHRRLARDLNIVLFDASQKAVRIFPRGYLREALAGIRRADALILTHADRVSELSLKSWRELFQKYKPGLPVSLARHAPAIWQQEGAEALPPECFRGHKALAFCGLANPESFRKTLEALGVEIQDFRTYPDHFNFRSTDVKSLGEWASSFPAGMPVLTTQKDFVKLRISNLGLRPLYYLRIEFDIFEGAAELRQLLRDKVVARYTE
ncbi:tetraacyldisaccharide 4'-kinase [Telmatocola sphagniphila]|uniref:Tetraacyldisaccharide 4'-kinase n=1 Tax=Telmatocola sphagniphila TaxID=1123043 RepID=A0A8E6BAD5_9BACT|nr:tetraacyldisaccharide 4'-kinase [Telmatocola sphagniphila]QVL34322.1 tetraacyldisaccharide 4'-kinase [Telmatocola sphagniphila]